MDHNPVLGRVRSVRRPRPRALRRLAAAAACVAVIAGAALWIRSTHTADPMSNSPGLGFEGTGMLEVGVGARLGYTSSVPQPGLRMVPLIGRTLQAPPPGYRGTDHALLAVALVTTNVRPGAPAAT